MSTDLIEIMIQCSQEIPVPNLFGFPFDREGFTRVASEQSVRLSANLGVVVPDDADLTEEKLFVLGKVAQPSVFVAFVPKLGGDALGAVIEQNVAGRVEEGGGGQVGLNTSTADWPR